MNDECVDYYCAEFETPGITLCDACNCMSKTIDGHCGKCGVEKDDE